MVCTIRIGPISRGCHRIIWDCQEGHDSIHEMLRFYCTWGLVVRVVVIFRNGTPGQKGLLLWATNRLELQSANRIINSERPVRPYPFLLCCCVRWITALDFRDFSLCGCPLATTLTLGRQRHDIPLFFVWTTSYIIRNNSGLIPFMMMIIKSETGSERRRCWMASENWYHRGCRMLSSAYTVHIIRQ